MLYGTTMNGGRLREQERDGGSTREFKKVGKRNETEEQGWLERKMVNGEEKERKEGDWLTDIHVKKDAVFLLPGSPLTQQEFTIGIRDPPLFLIHT